jgi:hypothetical protein
MVASAKESGVLERTTVTRGTPDRQYDWQDESTEFKADINVDGFVCVLAYCF